MQYLGLGILGVIFREIMQISIFFRFTLNIFSYNSRGFQQIKQNVIKEVVNIAGDKIPIIGYFIYKSQHKPIIFNSAIFLS